MNSQQNRRRGIPRTAEAMQAMVREDEAYRQRRLQSSSFYVKANKTANDDAAAQARRNPRKPLAFMAKRLDGTEQFAVFRASTSDREIIMNVGDVINNFEQNFRKTMQVIPHASKQKGELKLRKREAAERFVAYGDAAVAMRASSAAKPRRIMRHYMRVKRVLAKA